jgi:hypothetical protein
VELLDEPVVVWVWDDQRKVPAPREVSRTEAEALFGLHFARAALRLDPKDRSAQVAQLSIALEKAAERAGSPDALPAKDQATFNAATAAGSSLLGEVLETAIADGKTNLAAAAAMALGQVTDRAALSTGGRPHPLVAAVTAPGRRVQFAAAKAVVNLAPNQPFPGSSWVVPALGRFVANQPRPRAVVIDGNPNRGGQVAGFLMAMGYQPELELTGSQGFRTAAETADVELILVCHSLFRQDWELTDTLANLQADGRTAKLPLFVYGPYDLRIVRPNLERDFPGIRFLVQPVDAAMLEQQLRGRPAALTAAERTGYAHEAVALLARIAADRKSPLAADLAAVEPELTVALGSAETAPAAAAALSELPHPDAQRSLADVVLDPSRLPALRSQVAALVVHSIQRFGPLLTALQERHLAGSLNEEPDDSVLAGISAILKALKPASALAKAAATTPQPPAPTAPAAAPAVAPAPAATPPPIPPAAVPPGVPR